MVWTTDSLYGDISSISNVSTDELRSMLDDLVDEWVNSTVEADGLQAWILERFDLNLETVTKESFNEAVARRVTQVKNLFTLISNNEELKVQGEVMDNLGRIGKIIREARYQVRSTSAVFMMLEEGRNAGLPDQWNMESLFQFIDEDAKANNFQKVARFHFEGVAS